MYGSYYYKESGRIFNYMPLLFSINHILYNKRYINKTLSNILHVLFVQWPSMYSMYKILKIYDKKRLL